MGWACLTHQTVNGLIPDEFSLTSAATLDMVVFAVDVLQET